MDSDGFEDFEYLLVDPEEEEERVSNSTSLKSEFEIFSEKCIDLLGNDQDSSNNDNNDNNLNWAHDIPPTIPIQFMELKDYCGRDIKNVGVNEQTIEMSDSFFGLVYTNYKGEKSKIRFFENQIEKVFFSIKDFTVNFFFTFKLLIKHTISGEIVSEEPFFSCFRIDMRFQNIKELGNIYTWLYFNYHDYLFPFNEKKNKEEGGFKKIVYERNTINENVFIEEHERQLSNEIMVLKEQKLSEEDEPCIVIKPTSPVLERVEDFETEDEMILMDVKKKEKTNKECIDAVYEAKMLYDKHIGDEVRQFAEVARQFMIKCNNFAILENMTFMSLQEVSNVVIKSILNNRISEDARKSFYLPLETVFEHPNFKLDETKRREWVVVLDMLNMLTTKFAKKEKNKKKKKENEVVVKKKRKGLKKIQSVIPRIPTNSIKVSLKRLRIKVDDSKIQREEIVKINEKKEKDNITIFRKKYTEENELDEIYLTAERAENIVKEAKDGTKNIQEEKTTLWKKLINSIVSCFVGY